MRDGHVDAVVTLLGTGAPAPDTAEAPPSSADPFFAQLIAAAATTADVFGATPTTAPARVAGWHDAEPAVVPLVAAAGGAAFSVGTLTD